MTLARIVDQGHPRVCRSGGRVDRKHVCCHDAKGRRRVTGERAGRISSEHRSYIGTVAYPIGTHRAIRLTFGQFRVKELGRSRQETSDDPPNVSTPTRIGTTYGPNTVSDSIRSVDNHFLINNIYSSTKGSGKPLSVGFIPTCASIPKVLKSVPVTLRVSYSNARP